MYRCFNIVTDKVDFPSAVLLRAGEIIIDETIHDFVSAPRLANDHGKLLRYLKITKADYGLYLLESSVLYLSEDTAPTTVEITTTPRVNIEYARNFKLKPYRFYIADHKAISKK